MSPERADKTNQGTFRLSWVGVVFVVAQIVWFYPEPVAGPNDNYKVAGYQLTEANEAGPRQFSISFRRRGSLQS